MKFLVTPLCHMITWKLLIWNGYHAKKQTTGSKVFRNIYHPLYIFLLPNGYFWGPVPWTNRFSMLRIVKHRKTSFVMFYTLIKHGFLTNQSACRVSSILWYCINVWAQILALNSNSFGIMLVICSYPLFLWYCQ